MLELAGWFRHLIFFSPHKIDVFFLILLLLHSELAY